MTILVPVWCIIILLSWWKTFVGFNFCQQVVCNFMWFNYNIISWTHKNMHACQWVHLWVCLFHGFNFRRQLIIINFKIVKLDPSKGSRHMVHHDYFCTLHLQGKDFVSQLAINFTYSWSWNYGGQGKLLLVSLQLNFYLIITW